MTAPKKPTPVAILVMPRFRGEKPTCEKCPLVIGHFIDHYPTACRVGASEGMPETWEPEPTQPGPNCPVHGPPETRATPF